MRIVDFNTLHIGSITGHPNQLSARQYTAEFLRMLLARWGECSRRDIKAYFDSLPLIRGWNMTAIQAEWPKVLKQLCRDGDAIQVSSNSYWAVPLKGYRLHSGEVFLVGCSPDPRAASKYQYRGGEKSIQRWCLPDPIDFCEVEEFQTEYPPPFQFYKILRKFGLQNSRQLDETAWEILAKRVKDSDQGLYDRPCQLCVVGQFRPPVTSNAANAPDGIFPAYEELYNLHKQYRIVEVQNQQIVNFINLSSYEEYNIANFLQTIAQRFPLFEITGNKETVSFWRHTELPAELSIVYYLLKNSHNPGLIYKDLQHYLQKYFNYEGN